MLKGHKLIRTTMMDYYIIREFLRRRKCRKLIKSMIELYESGILLLKSDECSIPLYEKLSNMKLTYGICHLIESKKEINQEERDYLMGKLKLNGVVGYLFVYRGASTIRGASFRESELWCDRNISWREIAIKLCEMRIEYLKKFL